MFPATLPPSTATPLKGGPTLRWGILGVGTIADAFVLALHEHTDQRAVAVASRSADRAAEFAQRYGIPNSSGDYTKLVSDPDVDIVYIATTNHLHREHALLAIAAGKHILLEKPIALNAAEAREIAAAGRAAGVFAMEAMWTRFQPKSTVIAQLLTDGALGELKLASAKLGSRFPQDPTHRIYDPALGGGALLDLGVYSVWWNQFALGTPDRVSATGLLAMTGVDDLAVVTMDYPGARGEAIASASAELDNRGAIYGTDARIVAERFLAPGGFVLLGPDGASLEYADPTGWTWREGLCWQAAAVAQHVADGLTEAPEHPLDRSIAVMETIDAARAELGAA